MYKINSSQFKLFTVYPNEIDLEDCKLLHLPSRTANAFNAKQKYTFFFDKTHDRDLKKTVNKHVVLNCIICLQQTVKPKCLPCSHNFCEECLQHFISREAIGKKEASFEFKCPICRRVSGCPEQ